MRSNSNFNFPLGWIKYNVMLCYDKAQQTFPGKTSQICSQAQNLIWCPRDVTQVSNVKLNIHSNSSHDCGTLYQYKSSSKMWHFGNFSDLAIIEQLLLGLERNTCIYTQSACLPPPFKRDKTHGNAHMHHHICTMAAQDQKISWPRFLQIFFWHEVNNIFFFTF